MNRLPKHRWFQFRLRSLLLLVLLVAIGLSGWQYWRQTRHMWRLQWAIRVYTFSSVEENLLWQALARDRGAWNSGLVEALGGVLYDGESRPDLWAMGRRPLVWSDTFHDRNGLVHRLYLFQDIAIDDRWQPLICVVTDESRRFETWKHVADRSMDFISADIADNKPAELKVECIYCFADRVRYHYEVMPLSIDLVDEKLIPHLGVAD
jgi:hypothetical protein